MPICNKCGSQLATAELRRSPKGGYLCRDKARCQDVAGGAKLVAEAISRTFLKARNRR